MQLPDSSRGSAAFAHLGHHLPSAADAHLLAVLEIPKWNTGEKVRKTGWEWKKEDRESEESLSQSFISLRRTYSFLLQELNLHFLQVNGR